MQKNKLWDKKRGDIPIFKYVKSTLIELNKNFMLAIATTAPRTYVEHILQKNDIRGLFSIILTDNDVKHPKPHPDLLLSILRISGFPMNSLLMIGDTLNDYKMAKNAGCKFYLFDENLDKSIKPTKVKVISNWDFLLHKVNALRITNKDVFIQ